MTWNVTCNSGSGRTGCLVTPVRHFITHLAYFSIGKSWTTDPPSNRSRWLKCDPSGTVHAEQQTGKTTGLSSSPMSRYCSMGVIGWSGRSWSNFQIKIHAHTHILFTSATMDLIVSVCTVCYKKNRPILLKRLYTSWLEKDWLCHASTDTQDRQPRCCQLTKPVCFYSPVGNDQFHDRPCLLVRDEYYDNASCCCCCCWMNHFLLALYSSPYKWFLQSWYQWIVYANNNINEDDDRNHERLFQTTGTKIDTYNDNL